MITFFLRPWIQGDADDAIPRRKFYLPIYEGVKKEVSPELVKAEVEALDLTPNEVIDRIREAEDKAEKIALRMAEIADAKSELKALKDELLTLHILEEYRNFLIQEEEELILLLIQ